MVLVIKWRQRYPAGVYEFLTGEKQVKGQQGGQVQEVGARNQVQE
jgi:hypothetical protein